MYSLTYISLFLLFWQCLFLPWHLKGVQCAIELFKWIYPSVKHTNCVKLPPPTHRLINTHLITLHSRTENRVLQVQPLGNNSNSTSSWFGVFPGEPTSLWCCWEMQHNWWLLTIFYVALSVTVPVSKRYDSRLPAEKGHSVFLSTKQTLLCYFLPCWLKETRRKLPFLGGSCSIQRRKCQ